MGIILFSKIGDISGAGSLDRVKRGENIPDEVLRMFKPDRESNEAI
jgi:hypothetical protein